MLDHSSALIKTSIQFHNCAFHSLTPFIVAFLSDTAVHSHGFHFRESAPTEQQRLQFKQTAGYVALLDAFSEIYKIDKPKAAATLQALVEKYPHPLDLQVLLGPVLRQALKKILLTHTAHSEGLKKSFDGLLGNCLKFFNDKNIKVEGKNSEELEALLRTMPWGENEHEELFVPNIEYIAKLLSNNKLRKESFWDDIYRNYVNYLCDPAKSVYVSHDHVLLLANAFRFVTIVGETKPSSELGFSPLTTVRFDNASKDHWEIKKSNPQTQWDFTKELQHSQFKEYHQATINLMSLGVSTEILAKAQNTFQDKIHQVLTASVEYQDDALFTMPNFDWANNNGLEGLVNIIVDAVLEHKSFTVKTGDNNEINFKDTPEFTVFLNRLKNYYNMPQALTPVQVVGQLKQLLLAYPSPIERFMLLSPVIRNMIKAEDLASRISILDIKILCRGFNVALDIYASRGAEKVFSFDRVDSGFKEENTFTKLAISVAQDKWFLLESSELKVLQSNAQLVNATTAFGLEEVVVSDLQRRISDKLREGIPAVEISTVALVQAVKNKNLPLFVTLVNQGTVIIRRNVDDAALLKWAMEVTNANPQDVQFNAAFLLLLLSHAHQQRLSTVRFNSDAFVLNQRALGIIDGALERRQITWLKNLTYYVENAAILLNKNELQVASQENSTAIRELVAKHASKAISTDNAEKLNDYLTLDLRSLVVPGKFNPVHAALKISRYELLKNTLTSLFEKELEGQGEDAHQNFDERVENYLALVNAHAYDEHERTAAFRLDRTAYRAELGTNLANASLLGSMKIGFSLAKFYAGEAGIYCIDRFHKKTIHSQKIQQKMISKVGQPLMYAARALGTISQGGLFRFGLEAASYFMPNFITAGVKWVAVPTAKKVGKVLGASEEGAQMYAPIFIDNLVTAILMPHFYLASTALSNTVYYIFKDSEYDNLEAIAQLMANEAAYSWAYPKPPHEINDRYFYNLNKNLSPIFGEWATSNYLSPAIARMDSAHSQFAQGVNYSASILKPYLSASAIATITQTLGVPHISLEGFMPEQLKAIGEYAQKGMSYFNAFVQVKNWYGEFLANYLESKWLDQIGDSAFKQERLHAIQVFEVHRLNNNVSGLKEYIAALEKAEVVDTAALEKARAQLAGQESQLQAAIAKEDVLYQKTEGFKYYESWQKIHLDLLYAQHDTRVGAEKLAAMKQEEADAKAKCIFYNSDSTNKTLSLWEQSTNELFKKHEANFIDQTNIAGACEQIVKDTFNVNNNNGNQRNDMAQYAADEVIRYKYPFYPDIGDAVAIEAERQQLMQTITNDKLHDFKRKPGRSKDRLYDYVLAKITGTEVPKHVHKWEKIVKPFVNEISGKTIGWVPFKDFKGGRSSVGNVGFQVTHQVGQGMRADVTVANVPVFNVANTQKDKKAIVQQLIPMVSGTDVSPISNTELEKQPFTSLLDNPALSMDNPIIVDILAEQLENTFSVARKPKPIILPLFESTTRQTRSQTRMKATGAQPKQDAPKSKTPSRSKPVTKAPVTVIPQKTAPQAVKQNWWQLAYRSARGDNSPEVLEWQRLNRESIPKGVEAFIDGVSDSTIPVNELPFVFRDVVKESVVELLDGTVTLVQYAGNEVKLVVKGETPQTMKAIALLGIFLGEETARLILKEDTKTSQFAKELVKDFANLDKKDRVKGLAKLAISVITPKSVVNASRAKTAASVSTKATEVSTKSTAAVNQQTERLATLLGTTKEVQQTEVAVTAKPLTTKYNLRSQHAIVSNGVKLPIKATFVGEFNYHKTPNINIGSTPAKSFLGATYKSYILEQDITLHRAANSVRPIGDHFSFDKIKGEYISRVDNAVMRVWPNGRESIIDTAIKVHIPKGTMIHVGISAPQGGIFRGGSTQVYIENAAKIKGINVLETYPIHLESVWKPKAKG